MSVAFVLARSAVECMNGGQQLSCILIGTAALLVGAGFLTPASCLLSGATEIAWLVLHRAGEDWSRFLVASILIALTVLGPGAYSIDRWLFGRKRLTIGRPEH